MWELDCEESWAPKNWCSWTVVLEKTLESPLDCKEIQPVHPKGDQSWVFIWRTDAEAETPILWPPDVKSWLIGKDPDAGSDWEQEVLEGDNRGWDGWMASPTRWAWVWVNSRSWWWTGRPGVLWFMGSQRVRHDWVTELTDWLNQSYVFSSSHVWMWKVDYKESWEPKNWCFWTVILEKNLESPLDCKEIKPVNPKQTSPEYSLEGLMPAAKAPIFWPSDGKGWCIQKDPDAGKDWRQEEKGTTEDEMVGWNHQLNRHEFEEAPGIGFGQGNLACYSPWSLKESDMTEQLNWLNWLR